MSQPIAETNASWDLIAEMSKRESVTVFTTLLKQYDERACNHNHISTADTRYLSYPVSEIAALMKRLRMSAVFEATVPTEYNAFTRALETNKKGKTAVKKKEQIRNTQIIRKCFEADAFFQKRVRATLSPDFKSNVVEIILLYYVQISYYAYSSKLLTTFFDAAISFVSALRYHRPKIPPPLVTMLVAYKDWLNKQLPWPELLRKHDNYIINNHFKKYFRRALVPFPEQSTLLQHLRDDPMRSFLLPWGVGTGKTSMLPVLARIYERRDCQVLYHVPYGPIRDQSAALLYRCGIPYAYMWDNRNGTFTMQPSFYCGDKHLPVVLICDDAYLKYHAKFIEEVNQYERAMAGTTTTTTGEGGGRGGGDAAPPSYKIVLPSSARYAHLTLDNVWKRNYALIMDEPHGGSDEMRELFKIAPPVTFVMSATLFDTAAELHEMREWCVVPPVSVGVSTTLIGHWLDGEPIVTPFTNCSTVDELRGRIDRVGENVLYKRFLSGQALFDLGIRIKRCCQRNMNVRFDLATLTFDDIAHRYISWLRELVADDDFQDEECKALFSKETPKQSVNMERLMREIVVERSGEFRGGTILCGPSVEHMYEAMEPLLQHLELATIDDLDTVLSDRSTQANLVHEQLKRVSANDMDEIMMLTSQLDYLHFDKIPIAYENMVNTMEFIEKHNTTASKETQQRWTKRFPFVQLQPTIQEGIPGQTWSVSLDTITSRFRTDHANELRWRFHGVGSIIGDKVFNMKNIADIEEGRLAFLLVDALGAQGMNLSISNGILLPDHDGTPLSPDLCLQATGRVGRWNQSHSGRVLITTPALFESLFAHVVV